MTTFVVITEHPPQLCQTSNAKCAELSQVAKDASVRERQERGS